VGYLTKVLNDDYPGVESFQQVAVLPDDMKRQGVTAFNAWHYINIPYVLNGVKPPVVAKQNVVWAIGQAEQVLSSSKTNRAEKALFLSFLVHLTGDVHQPLHAITRCNKKLPRCDQGGNLFPVKTKYADNLHKYWDQGLNFYNNYYTNYPLSQRQIDQLAQILEKKYPKHSFKQANNLNPQEWAQESYQIARKFVYNIKPNTKPSQSYVTTGQAIVEQRLVLAGYRLAAVLNQTFAKK